jgi:hypothetical protein
MKRNFVVSFLGGFATCVMMLLLLGAAGRADAQRAETSARAVSAAASVTSTFTYQGQLKNGGTPVNGSCDMQFSLWDAVSGSNQIGSIQTVLGQAVSMGLFTVVLNSGGEFGATPFTGEARWLQVAVKCGSDVSYTALDRQLLTATPYAASLMPGAVISGSNNVMLTVNITSSAANAKGIFGHLLNNDPGASAAAVAGFTEGTGDLGIGVYGYHANRGWGVYGQAPYGVGVRGSTITGTGLYGSSITGTGVLGESANGVGVIGTAPVTGVQGTSTSSFGAGVYGRSTGYAGAGVYGFHDNFYGSGVHGKNPSGTGVWGETRGGFGVSAFAYTGTAIAGNSAYNGESYGIPAGTGVYGFSSNNANAVHGRSNVPGKAGVYGYNDNRAGYGVYGTAPITGVTGVATDTFGVGVHGLNDAEYGTGVWGASSAPHGIGVRGVADSVTGNPVGVVGVAGGPGTGVYGIATGTSGANKGVIGTTSSGEGTGVWAHNVVITGTALTIDGGIRVPGAGISTTTPVFIHIATADNMPFSHVTCIDNAMTNGDAGAILFITQNYQPNSVYNAHPVGVFYTGLDYWCIFNEDNQAMSVGAAFNVMVIKP